MTVFMIDWFSISFLYLFVILGSESLEGQDLMDLSMFDYSAADLQGDVSIRFSYKPGVKMQVNCSKCIKLKPGTIKCVQNDPVVTNIELEEKGFRLSFPFNFSCNTWSDLRNGLRVLDIETSSRYTDMSISWTPPATKTPYVNHYLLIVIDSSGVYTRNISTETSYKIKDLKEKTWHQICIASIYLMWKTSRFKCKKALTDFSTTGPVTNVTATPESDMISMSWSRPEYKYDIPEGYFIYLQGRINQTCRVYILKRPYELHPTNQYSCVNTKTIITSLLSLEIKDLPPNSEFTIEISPFNRNKKSVIKRLTIKTKEGESGPVQNLKVDIDRDPHNIYVSFDTPINPAGIILKYRMRLIMKKINICTSNDDVIHEEYTNVTFCYIPKSVLKKCASYEINVAPLNKWNANGGIGKTASEPFNYNIDHQSSWTVNAKFISSNYLTVSFGGLKEDKCEIFGFIIEIKDEKDHSNCLTRIISSLDCDAFKTSNTLRSQMKNLNISCKSIKYVNTMIFDASFIGLYQNSNYQTYIAPIMAFLRVGSIRNKTFRTLVAKPHIPKGVSYELDTLRNIKLIWHKNIETWTYGPSEGYIAHIINKNNGRKISTKIKRESVTFSDLGMCTEYCFVISSYNRAGNSDNTKELCTFTLAPKPGKSQLADPPSGYMRSQSLNWTYLGSDNCRKAFLVEYRVKYLSEQPLYLITDSTSALLPDLKPNVIYKVTVQAESQMKTVNNENLGQLSSSKVFYTGKLKPYISYYEENLDYTNRILNISWRIDEEMQGSIFMYIIQVKNFTRHCAYSVLLTCQTCREPWIWSNVKDQHEESLTKLMNCTASLNQSMDAEETSFNYLLKSEKIFTDYFVEIYGINLMGIHLLNKRTPDTSFSVLILLITVTAVVFSLLFGTFSLILVKRNSKRKDESTVGKSHLVFKWKKVNSHEEHPCNT